MPTYLVEVRHSRRQSDRYHDDDSYHGEKGSSGRKTLSSREAQDFYDRHTSARESSTIRTFKQPRRPVDRPYYDYDYNDYDARLTRATSATRRSQAGDSSHRVDSYYPRAGGPRYSSVREPSRHSRDQSDWQMRKNFAPSRIYDNYDEVQHGRSNHRQSGVNLEPRRGKDWGYATAYGRSLDEFSREAPVYNKGERYAKRKYGVKTVAYGVRQVYDKSGASIALGPVEAALEGFGALVIGGAEALCKRR